jgi:hypothetical protein
MSRRNGGSLETSATGIAVPYAHVQQRRIFRRASPQSVIEPVYPKKKNDQLDLSGA